jgi:hypothetical protein
MTLTVRDVKASFAWVESSRRASRDRFTDQVGILDQDHQRLGLVRHHAALELTPLPMGSKWTRVSETLASGVPGRA